MYAPFNRNYLKMKLLGSSLLALTQATHFRAGSFQFTPDGDNVVVKERVQRFLVIWANIKIAHGVERGSFESRSHQLIILL